MEDRENFEEVFLDKQKIINILELYYGNKIDMECKVEIETSVEYYDGRYNEIEQRPTIKTQITIERDFYGKAVPITKTLRKKDVEDVIAEFLKNDLPSIDYYDYKYTNGEFEGITAKQYNKDKTYGLNYLDD